MTVSRQESPTAKPPTARSFVGGLACQGGGLVRVWPRCSTVDCGRGGGPRGCSQMCNRDSSGQWRRGGTSGPVGLGRCAAGERACTVWDECRGAHNPEVAGSNPAPATKASQVRGPFPLGVGLLPCVARDQIRDQDGDQGRLSRSASSHDGTHWDWTGHPEMRSLGRNPAVAPGPPATSMTATGPSSPKRIAKTAASPCVHGLKSGTVPKPIGDRTPTRCLVGGLAVGVLL